MENNIMDIVVCATFSDKGTFSSIPITVTVSLDGENASISSGAFNGDLEMPATEAKGLLAKTMEETSMLILTKTGVQIDTADKSVDEVKTMLEHEQETYNKWLEMMSDVSKESFDKEAYVSVHAELHGSEYGADVRFAVIMSTYGEGHFYDTRSYIEESNLFDNIEDAVARAKTLLNEANQKWMVIENGQFVSQTDEQIAENPNRDFYRKLDDEKYEVLSVKDATTPFTLPTSSVSHWKEFSPKEAFEALPKEDVAWIEEQMNGIKLQDLSPADFANTMLYNGGQSQPHDMSAVGGEFYPHEIPVYMEQLDSDTPLSPADYQASLSLEQQTENYKIANDIYEKQETIKLDNQKNEAKKSNKENEYSLD